MLQRYPIAIFFSAVLSMTMLLQGCQPKQDKDVEKASESSSNKEVQHFDGLLHAKTVKLTLPSQRACDGGMCTDFEVQHIKTNQKWINDYFDARIKKDIPLAFEVAEKNTVKENLQDVDLSKTSILVRYIGQNDQLATFVMTNSIYTAGAAHGMYHHEYVNFDLKHKKRIALQDLLMSGSENQVIRAIYDANSMWLSDHSIIPEKLKLSDNFYYGAQGIVFVYPLYELASYAEGMTELVLPYHMVKKLIKPEYLPNLPIYPSS